MNLKELNALSKLEVQMKAAELSGWNQVGVLNDGKAYGSPPKTWKKPHDPFPADTSNVWLLPDYLNDMEAALSLWCGIVDGKAVAHNTTADQVTRAFILTRTSEEWAILSQVREK